MDRLLVALQSLISDAVQKHASIFLGIKGDDSFSQFEGFLIIAFRQEGRDLFEQIILGLFRLAWIDQKITDKRHAAAIGRPTRYIDGSLATKQLSEDLDGTALDRQQTELNLFIRRMTFHVLGIRQEHDPLAVRRRMWKPIVEVAIG